MEYIGFEVHFSGQSIENRVGNVITRRKGPLTGDFFDEEQYFSMGPKTSKRYRPLLSETIKISISEKIS